MKTEKKDKKSLSQTIGSIVGLIVGTIAGYAAFYLVSSFLDASFFSVEKQLEKVVKDTNSKLPVVIDETTRLDSMSVLGVEILNYYYTCILWDKEDVDLNSFDEHMSSHLLNTVKTSPDLKIFRDLGITMIYIYNDKDGDLLYTYKATPDMYK